MGYVNLNCFDDLQNYDIPFATLSLEDFDPRTRQIVDSDGRTWDLTSQSWSGGFTQYRLRTTGSLTHNDVYDILGDLGLGSLSGYYDADITDLYDTPERYGSNTSTIIHEPYMTLFSDSWTNGQISYTISGNTYSWGMQDGMDNMAIMPLCVADDQGNIHYGTFWIQKIGGGGMDTLVSFVFSDNVTESNFGEYEPEAGEEGFEPTNDINPGKTIGGGHGKNPDWHTDTISNPDVPDETDASAIKAGFLNVYMVDTTNLNKLGECLFGSTLAGFLINVATNPLDYVASLNIFPCSPEIGSSTAIKLGRWNCISSVLGADASGRPLTSQFKRVQFGTVQIEENWGSFLDYSATTVQLYLPFIGVVDIDVNEVMNGSITVDYIVDFFTGSCVANVCCVKTIHTPTKYGTQRYNTVNTYAQHSYQGNCAIQVPLTTTSYGSMIGSLIQAVASGVTGNMTGAVSGAVSAIDSALKPPVSSKGSITANGGFCAILYPYISITRPITNIPDSYQETVGYPSYVDSTLGACTGLCICDNIKLQGISGATESEMNRIIQMCKEGVYV